MANWSNPILTSTYTNFVTEVKDRDVDVAVWFEGISPTNLPTNAKRLNTTNGRFEKWNGTSWVDAIATFTFPALSVAGNATVTGTLGVTSTTTLTGALTINGGIANNPTLTSGTANGVLYLNGSKVATSGTDLVFNATGLGIGTSSPAERLTAAAGGVDRVGMNISGAITQLRLGSSGAGDAMMVLQYNRSTGTYQFSEGTNGNTGSPDIAIDASGNLGIGTGSPSYRLHSETTFGSVSPSSLWRGAALQATYTRSDNSDVVIRRISTGATNYASFIQAEDSSLNTVFLSLNPNGGNVGIGTSSPSAKLHVVGNQFRQNDATGSYGYVINTTSGTTTLATLFGGSSFAIQTAGSGTNQLLLDASGNLGIGTSLPGAKLDVVGAIYSSDSLKLGSGKFVTFSASAPSVSNFSLYGDGTQTVLNAPSAGVLKFNNNNVEQMRLDASGNFGINYTPVASTTSKLHLGGDISLLAVGANTVHYNSYYDTTWKARNAGYSSAIRFVDSEGVLQFWTSPASVAANASSNIAERLRLTSTGDLEANSSVTGYWRLPNGTTAQRPAGAAGQIRFNTTLSKYEGHNGSGWSSIGGGATGGGTDDIFYENGQTVTTNYTITTNKNAMSAGPVTIASGITVTVPSGSNWAVL